MTSLRVATAAAVAAAVLVAAVLSPPCHAFTSPNHQQQTVQAPSSALNYGYGNGEIDCSIDDSSSSSSRRSFMITAGASLFSAVSVGVGQPSEADAATDCFSDCLKNCKLIAPKDPQYCQGNCVDYCAQPDRTDGLSGSVSSEGGETGILGTTTVVKGEDKPPSVKIPGLDFTSDKGRKLLGY